MRVFGTVEVSYSIDVPSTVTKEELTKHVINAIKNKIKDATRLEASTNGIKLGVDKDAEWTLTY